LLLHVVHLLSCAPHLSADFSGVDCKKSNKEYLRMAMEPNTPSLAIELAGLASETVPLDAPPPLQQGRRPVADR
jgi:hypothetical protein